MKKLIVLALSTGLLVWALGVGANSADAACSTKCLTKKIKKLHRQRLHPKSVGDSVLRLQLHQPVRLVQYDCAGLHRVR